MTERDVVRGVVLPGVGNHLLGHVAPDQVARDGDGLVQEAGGDVPRAAAHVQDVLLLLPGHGGDVAGQHHRGVSPLHGIGGGV